MDELGKLAEKAKSAHERFRAELKGFVNKHRAKVIRQMRVEEGCTWRKVAQECHKRFNGNWYPASNQLAGMALCEHAAVYFGEHYRDEQWN